MPVSSLRDRPRITRAIFVVVVFALILTLIWRPRPYSLPSQYHAANYGAVRLPSSFGNRSITITGTEASQPGVEPVSVGNPPPTNSRIHIVVAHYDEEPFYMARWLGSLRDIPSIATLGVHVSIYTKGPSPEIESLRSVSTADQIIRLPNVGREGSTYLHHILSHWDNLPPYTLFTQAVLREAQIKGSGPEAGKLQEWVTMRLQDRFVTAPLNGTITGFMSLNRNHDICHCGHCTDMGARDEFYPLWPQIFAIISGRVCEAREPSVLSFNGHLIVSKRRILERPRALYQYLQSLVDAPEGHWLHGEKEPKWFERAIGKSTPQNPKFGHTLERLWHVIFGCAEVEQVRDCDVRGSPTAGEGGCSCMDSEVS